MIAPLRHWIYAGFIGGPVALWNPVFADPITRIGDVAGSINHQGAPLVNTIVDLEQPPGTPLDTTSTDVRGEYRFTGIEHKDFQVIISGDGEGSRGSPEGFSCPSGLTVNVPVAYGDLINCEIEEIADVDEYSFDASVGETVMLNVVRRSGGGTPCLQAFDPSGSRVATACEGSSIFRVGSNGLFTVLISDLQDDQTVEYAFNIERINPPSPSAGPVRDGEIVNDTINGVGDVDIFFFSGLAGGTVLAQISRRPSEGTLCLSVYDTAGEPHGQVCGGTLLVELFETGVYTLVVGERFSPPSNIFEYTLALNCVFGAACIPPTSFADLSGFIEQDGSPLVNAIVDLEQPPGTPSQTTSTDIRGEYQFANITDQDFRVVINGEGVPPPQCEPPVPGDLDGDCDVDRDDVQIIVDARGTDASGPDDPRDRDGDGRITGLDARQLVLLCTRANCATE